jgi:serine/threonine-protein kinase mTOR
MLTPLTPPSCYFKFAPNYELLQALQKIKAFEHGMRNTSGDDLYNMFWLKSVSSEHWLQRRTNYTRSLAVNSMAGHTLGLVDRHPSNLLTKRDSGEVVHIDFGNCFEVAMQRVTLKSAVPTDPDVNSRDGGESRERYILEKVY